MSKQKMAVRTEEMGLVVKSIYCPWCPWCENLVLGSQPSGIKPSIPHILVMETPRGVEAGGLWDLLAFSAWGVGEGHKKEAPGPERQTLP